MSSPTHPLKMHASKEIFSSEDASALGDAPTPGDASVPGDASGDASTLNNEIPGKSEDHSDATNLVISKLDGRNLAPEADVSLSPEIEAPSMTGIDLEEFHLFQKLPPEIRIRIWKLTFPRDARVIALYSSAGDATFQMKLFPYMRHPPTPAALHVNSESREEALKIYELCFNDGNPNTPKIYVNLAQDIFFFVGPYFDIDVPTISFNPLADQRAARMTDDTRHFMSTSSLPNLNKIQRLITGWMSFHDQFGITGRGTTQHYGLPANLKELLVVGRNCGKQLLRSGAKFIETTKDKEEEMERNSAEGGAWSWWMEKRKLVTRIFEDAKSDNPDWVAPELKFGMAEEL